MNGPLYIAVDLGAGSGRVFLSGVDAGEFLLEEIHRFVYPPRQLDGVLRWDIQLLFSEIKFGLRAAGERARQLDRTVESVAVDSWGVDYALLDQAGNVLEDPACYRDNRTEKNIPGVFARVPRSEIFEKTGIQFLPFNTIYQLSSEKDLGEAAVMLLIPDLIHYFLTGTTVCEYTNATTTQLVDVHKRDWDEDLISKLDLPSKLFAAMVPPGTVLGTLKPEIAAELELDGLLVVAPATHDTASAVAGTPLAEGSAYISSGTWSLIGIERNEPLINAEVEKLNFTNEGGAYGKIRFLKNVMGLWIFESCRREWEAAGLAVGYEELLGEVAEIAGHKAFIFPDDPRLLNPDSMVSAIKEQLKETGQDFGDTPAEISKIILDSLAFRYASVLRSIEDLTSTTLSAIQIVGGGGRNRYLNQMTANASGTKAYSGLTEATVVGNVLVQAIASGRFQTPVEARTYVADSFQFDEFMPDNSFDLNDAAELYRSIEKRFVQ